MIWLPHISFKLRNWFWDSYFRQNSTEIVDANWYLDFYLVSSLAGPRPTLGYWQENSFSCCSCIQGYSPQGFSLLGRMGWGGLGGRLPPPVVESLFTFPPHQEKFHPLDPPLARPYQIFIPPSHQKSKVFPGLLSYEIWPTLFWWGHHLKYFFVLDQPTPFMQYFLSLPPTHTFSSSSLPMVLAV